MQKNELQNTDMLADKRKNEYRKKWEKQKINWNIHTALQCRKNKIGCDLPASQVMLCKEGLQRKNDTAVRANAVASLEQRNRMCKPMHPYV